jgi:uncharacterized protein (TIGR03437 family)
MKTITIRPGSPITLTGLRLACLATVAACAAFGQAYTISTFAGSGPQTSIPGTSTQLTLPTGVAADSVGNVYLVDPGVNSVLRLDARSGILTRVAGNGTPGYSGDNGPGSSAQLNAPNAVALDSLGNIYIADSGNNVIRKLSDGVITTIAGNGTFGFSGDNGPATAAQLNTPNGLAIDGLGNLYVANTSNSRIRKVSQGTITTIAGNGTRGFSGDSGPAASAELYYPSAVAVDAAGNLYICDSGNGRIREVSNGTITTIAGGGKAGIGVSGPALNAQFAPTGLASDPAGNLYISDVLAQLVSKISGGMISTIAGTGAYGFSGDGGPATSAQLNSPLSVAADSSGNVFIADTYNYRIRKVTNGTINTVAGGGTQSLGDGGPPIQSQLNSPQGLAADAQGNLYIADSFNNRIRKVANGVITTVAGNGVRVPGSGGTFSGDGGPATSAQLSGPQGVAVDTAGNIYIADTSNSRVRKVSGGIITTVAGGGKTLGDNGPATSALVNYPSGVAVDAAGNLYIADTNNSRIRKVTFSTGVITTVAGTGTIGYSGDNGPAASAQLYAPSAVAVDSAGNLFIADAGNQRVRKVTNGVITTVAGSIQGLSGDNGPGALAELNSPEGIAVSSNGVYIADTGNNHIRLLTPGTPPAITLNGIVPIYSSASSIQPGSWVSIYGTDLASSVAVWNGNFPTSLGGTSVMIDNKPAYLWLVSPTQINLQVPDDATSGMVSVAVTTASGTATSTVTLSPQGPSFSLLGDGRHVAGEIATPNGSGAYGAGTYDLVGPSGTFSYSTRPVKAGETLILYGVGFGPTTQTVPAGKAFSGAAPCAVLPQITIGGVQANVAFAGIIEAGLYQFNLTVPPNTGSGDLALLAIVNGVQSPAGVVVTVQ